MTLRPYAEIRMRNVTAVSVRYQEAQSDQSFLLNLRTKNQRVLKLVSLNNSIAGNMQTRRDHFRNPSFQKVACSRCVVINFSQ